MALRTKLVTEHLHRSLESMEKLTLYKHSNHSDGKITMQWGDTSHTSYHVPISLICGLSVQNEWVTEVSYSGKGAIEYLSHLVKPNDEIRFNVFVQYLNGLYQVETILQIWRNNLFLCALPLPFLQSTENQFIRQ